MTLLAAHTPGPWIDAGPLGKGRWITTQKEGDGGAQIAVVYGPTVTLAALANARLIAAAPDLLAALRAGVEYVAQWAEGHPDDSSYQVMNAMDNAIAKANGDDEAGSKS